jgi:uncharacterized protein HemX
MDDAEYLAVDNKRLLGIISNQQKTLDENEKRLEFKDAQIAELQATIKDLLSKHIGD